jgi:hypothetical protein
MRRSGRRLAPALSWSLVPVAVSGQQNASIALLRASLSARGSQPPAHPRRAEDPQRERMRVGPPLGGQSRKGTSSWGVKRERR